METSIPAPVSEVLGEGVLPADQLISDLQARIGCSEAEAEGAVRGLRHFLDACANSMEPISPSPLVDEAWHAFILDTEAYAAYCDQRFGGFIHHRRAPASEDAYLRARELVAASAEIDPSIWPETGAADCSNGCSGQKIWG